MTLRGCGSIWSMCRGRWPSMEGATSCAAANSKLWKGTGSRAGGDAGISKHGAGQALVRLRGIRGHEGGEVQSGDDRYGIGRGRVGCMLTAFAGDASV